MEEFFAKCKNLPKGIICPLQGQEKSLVKEFAPKKSVEICY
jgi:hypothetical protein